MTMLRRSLIASAVLVLFGVPTAPALASTFDGQWSVQIASNRAACGDGAVVSIGISNGQVASESASVTASGHVAEAGAISVTLASGIKRAIGSGHLEGSTGSGTWHGPMCSGTWTAQRI